MKHDLGKYKLIRRIAVGGMAEIFLATIQGEAGFERRIIIKKILPTYAGDAEFARRLIDEGLLASRLTHANIVQVLDLGRLGPDYFIAMEFVDGPDVRTILQRAREREFALPAPIGAHILWEVARALAYAHQKRDSRGEPYGIVHRDISPANVLISWEGAVKLADFGIAKARYRLVNTLSGVLQGKFPYMSPEQGEGEELDQRSDIFSFGTLAYELLTLNRPFQAKSDIGILEKIRKAEYEDPRTHRPELSEELVAIIHRCLEKDREKRFEDGAELERALALVLQHNGWVVGEADVADLLSILYGEDQRSVTEGLDTIPEDEIRIYDARPIDPSDVTGYGTNPPIYPLPDQENRTRSVRLESWQPKRSSRRWMWMTWLLLLAGGTALLFGDYLLWHRVLGPTQQWTESAASSEIMALPKKDAGPIGPTDNNDIAAGLPEPLDVGTQNEVLSDLTDITETNSREEIVDIADLRPELPPLDGIDASSSPADVREVLAPPEDVTRTETTRRPVLRPTATRIVTLPPHVNVSIDGEDAGQSPVLIRLAPGQDQTIRLHLPGYEGQEFVLEYPGPRKLSKRLKFLPTGTLFLRYFPASAQVTIDGRPVSGKNGMNIIETELSVGSHRIDVGFQEQKETRDITIEKDRQWRGTITVEP